MENPSLRVSGHVSSRAKDEVTGEQGYGDDERSCVWTSDDTECAWASRPFKCRQVKRRKGKGRDDPEGLDEHSLVMSKRKILNGGKKRSEFGGPKERKARMACQKAMMASTRVVLALTSPTKVQARTFPKAKAEERIKKEKVKKEFFLNPEFSASETMKKDLARPGNQTIGLPVTGLMIPGRQRLGGSAQAQNCMDGGNSTESCQPSNTCGPGPWLHMVDWIKSGN